MPRYERVNPAKDLHAFPRTPPIRRVRPKQTKDQRGTGSAAQRSISLDDGTVTTPAALAIIQALIPLGLRAVEEALLAEVQRLAGPRYARNDDRPGGARSRAPPFSPTRRCRSPCPVSGIVRRSARCRWRHTPHSRHRAHPTYGDAKRALDRLSHELRVLNESAAASLAEGLEETLTLHRLQVFPELGVSFRSSHLIERVMARLGATTHRVTR